MGFNLASFAVGKKSGEDVFATIAVKSDQGAPVTATDGKKVVKASKTDGFALLPIPTPKSVPQAWTVQEKINGKTISKIILVETYGARYEATVKDITLIKNKAAATDYCRISNAIGDGAVFKGRGFTRTTDEPVLFCGADGSYNSYCVVSNSSTPPEHTYLSMGDLKYTNTITLQNGKTLYCHFMNGMWTNDISTIEWTVDGKSENLGNTTYIGCSGSLTTAVLSATGTNASEFEEILNEFYEYWS